GNCRRKLSVFGAGRKPLIVTDDDFDQLVLRADRPVLLDCWATWCWPGRMIAPIIDQLAAESDGRYLVAKLNTDENRRTASQFRIDAIPTLLIFNHGQLVDRIVGMASKQAILAKLEQVAAAPA